MRYLASVPTIRRGPGRWERDSLRARSDDGLDSGISGGKGVDGCQVNGDVPMLSCLRERSLDRT